MKKTLTSLVLAAMALSFALSGCGQWAARTFGGSTTYNLAPGEQLITITWKESSLWILTYNPATKECKFQENSTGGALEGTVHIPNCTPYQPVGTPNVVAQIPR